MRLVKIRYTYPRKIDGKNEYKPSSGTAIVSDTNLESFIAETNIIDCICGTMKLIIMSKQKADTPFKSEIVELFKRIDEYNDKVHGAIIDLFAEKNESVDPIYELKTFKHESFELAKRFSEIVKTLE